MALIPALISFSPNTIIKSSEVNQNFTSVRDAFNNTAVLTDVARTIAVPVTVALGVITTDLKVLDLSATWNAAGVTFNGLKLNITDTASAAGSLLLNLQTGGGNRLLVGKDGRASLGVTAALSAATIFAVGGAAPSGVTTADQSAINFDFTGSGAATSTIRGLTGLVRTPSGLVTASLIGFHASTHLLGGGGSTATNAVGFFAGAQTVGTNNAAFWAGGGAHGGTNAYGLLVGNITGAVNNFAIKTGTGLVELGDTLRFTVATTKVVPGATSLSLRNTADSADNLLLTDAGLATFRNTITTTPSVGGKGLVILGATQTTDQPLLDLAQTWNAAGVVFTALKLNVTNTASNVNASFADFQLAGTSKFRVGKFGTVHINLGSVSAGENAIRVDATFAGAGGPQAMLQGTVTWNNGGAVMEAIQLVVTDTASAANSMFLSFTLGGTTRIRFPKQGGVVLQGAALATTATDGFLYLPTCAGTPTGVPTAYTGTVALVFDTTGNKVWVYDGAWIATAALT